MAASHCPNELNEWVFELFIQPNRSKQLIHSGHSGLYELFAQPVCWTQIYSVNRDSFSNETPLYFSETLKGSVVPLFVEQKQTISDNIVSKM